MKYGHYCILQGSLLQQAHRRPQDPHNHAIRSRCVPNLATPELLPTKKGPRTSSSLHRSPIGVSYRNNTDRQLLYRCEWQRARLKDHLRWADFMGHLYDYGGGEIYNTVCMKLGVFQEEACALHQKKQCNVNVVSHLITYGNGCVDTFISRISIHQSFRIRRSYGVRLAQRAQR